MKRRVKKKSPEYVQVCPRCKSLDIQTDKSDPLSPSLGLPESFVCNRCGHSSTSFPEVEISKVQEFEMKYPGGRHGADKDKLVNTSFGEFEVRFEWKYLSIIVALLGISNLLLVKPLTVYIIMSSMAIALVGAYMFYVTYFPKRHLKP
ncbi:MAG: hypothetical protein ABIF10_01500 [Candidatus Woesearchaeota archaeon]